MRRLACGLGHAYTKRFCGAFRVRCDRTLKNALAALAPHTQSDTLLECPYEIVHCNARTHILPQPVRRSTAAVRKAWARSLRLTSIDLSSAMASVPTRLAPSLLPSTRGRALDKSSPLAPSPTSDAFQWTPLAMRQALCIIQSLFTRSVVPLGLDPAFHFCVFLPPFRRRLHRQNRCVSAVWRVDGYPWLSHAISAGLQSTASAPLKPCLNRPSTLSCRASSKDVLYPTATLIGKCVRADRSLPAAAVPPDSCYTYVQAPDQSVRQMT